MHEQSETVQAPDGRWINVYGRGTQKAGQPLPGLPTYGTVDEAVAAAKARSSAAGRQKIIDALRPLRGSGRMVE